MSIKELIMRFDSIIKITLLFFHFVGFSIWFATLLTNKVSISAIALTFVSGFLLVIRELIKDGLIWFTITEGIFTIVKVFLLAAAFMIEAKNPIVFIIVMLLGILSAHLPAQIKNKRII